MRSFSYPVLAFRQQDGAPIQVAFVAYAGEILEWAGVPRKSDELLTGYQRFRDDKRVDQEIVPFFSDRRNCSPTAIIVALRGDSGVGRCVLDPSVVEAGRIVQGTLRIEFDDTTIATDDVFEAAKRYVAERLATSVEDAARDEVEDEEEEGEDADEEEGGAEEDEDSIAHLGTVTLTRLKEVLDDRSNWENENFRAAMADYVKPAFLIDGQHRTAAAAKLGPNGLPFIVCGLYDPPWEEQVFQFTVVNLKPKRIPPALITAIAGLSLTREESNQVEVRLSNAGVRMDEVTIMSLVAYDDASPFADAVDMAVQGPGSDRLIGYGSMKRIAKVWYRASRVSLTQIAKRCFDTNNSASGRKRWRDDRLWFEFFCRFWAVVHDTYPDLWRKAEGNRLFIGAHLWALQEVLLTAADGQVQSHWNVESDDEVERKGLLIDRLIEVVRMTLGYFPKELWTTPWARASQDTNAGRAELVEFFEEFVEGGKKGGGLWKNWRKSPWIEAKS